MARKKKKLTRKQRKQQRREAIARKRKERGWESPQPPSGPRQDAVLDDMLPLFPEIGDSAASSISTAERLMMTLMDSGDMVDEPEFEEIIVDPILCMETFANVVQELDIEPESLDELPDEEREDAQMTIREAITRRLLTDELRRDIINGLNDLRMRLKRSGGEREEVARAAALQSFLGGDTGSEIWPMIGLVQAIFLRSLTIGFELMEVATEIAETTDSSESDVALTEKLARSSVGKKAADLLKKVPGLGGFLDKQADKIWEEGVDAVFKGELYLELFSPEELEPGFKVFGTVFRRDIAEETDTPESLSRKVSGEDVETVVSKLGEYIANLLTPERLDQLRARLNAILKDPAYAGKWSAFLHMLAGYLMDEDAVENEKQFLIQALIGEMAFVTAAFQEEDD
jgi:hypothetical protein